MPPSDIFVDTSATSSAATRRRRAKLERLQAAIDEDRRSGVSDRTLDDIWYGVKRRHEK
jgi:hypothetical protein